MQGAFSVVLERGSVRHALVVFLGAARICLDEFLKDRDGGLVVACSSVRCLELHQRLTVSWGVRDNPA
jgi:hypothetical protein